MALAKPRFVCGVHDVQPEHPSGWNVPPMVQAVTNTTLDGTTVRDHFWRKYSYVLAWDAMSKTDYEDLEDLVNYSLENNAPVTFTYGKWDLAASGITVLAELSDRGFRAGSGDTGYYVQASIKLTEVSAR